MFRFVAFSRRAGAVRRTRRHSLRVEHLEDRLTPAAPSDWVSPQPPSPGPNVIWVDTLTELQDAVRNVQSGQTIVIEPGEYRLTQPLFIGKDRPVQNVTLLGATGNFNDVVLRGAGMNNTAVRLGISVYNAQDVVIQDLSVGDVYYHAIDLQGSQGAERVSLKHCRLFDTGEQHLKASTGGGGVDDCVVESCVIEYTDAPPTTDHGGGIGDINGLDAHQADNWIIRDNVFRNFHNPDGVDHPFAPALLVWNGSSGTRVEGNTFIDCDRAIALGLIDQAGFDHEGGVVRNNFVYQTPGLFSSARRSSSDAQIVVYDSPNTVVLHNTILTNGNSRLSIEVRWANQGVEFRNNLTDAPLGARNGGVYASSGNSESAVPGMFVNPANGDLHLRDTSATRSLVIDAVPALSGVTRDWDRGNRPSGSAADIGADEFASTSGNRPPQITSPATATRDSSTTAQLSVEAGDEDEATLTYTWKVLVAPSNGRVTFSVNGSNAAADTVATFSKAGGYAFRVKVRDSAGLTVTSDVQLTVTQAVTTLQIDPTDGTLTAGSSVRFSATARDQFGRLMGSSPVDWSVTGVGAITPTGRYSTSLDLGAAVVEATSGSVSATADVTVIASLSPVRGLLATYYDNTDFTGSSVTQVDPTVDFAWGDIAPVVGVGSEAYSVRWEGQVRAVEAGPYTFRTRSSGGVRLWVNGELLIDNWAEHSATVDVGTIRLAAGQSYDIRLEYYENSDEAGLKLQWLRPGQAAFAVIPSTQLRASAG